MRSARFNQGKVTHGLSRKGAKKPIELIMWYSAKARAKKKNLSFSLKLQDIVVPEVCPVLGIKLIKGNRKQHFDSPTLDRKIPELGYTKENTEVISYRANLLKSNASVQELQKVLEYLIKVSEQNAF
jgi:hypothetical protein